MKMEVKMEGLNGVLDLLKSLPPEVVSKRGGPVRSALRKGALVIQQQARANFRAAVAQPGLTGITQSSGLTEQSIIIKRRQLTQIKGERFVVTVRSVPHPSGRLYVRSKRKPAASQIVRTNDIAFFMEVGTATQPATPWLRPAFESRAQDAIATTERELIAGLDRIIKRLTKGKA